MVVVGVPGAFRGPWSWERVVPRLEAAGVTSVCPSLRGMDGGAGSRPVRVRLGDWVEDVVEAAGDADEVVLAGHSQGGLVIAAAWPALGDRVRHLVYLDAPVPRPGERGVDVSGLPPGAPLPPEDLWLEPSPIDESSGLDAATVAWVNERLVATPFGPSLDPVPGGGTDEPARTVVFCSETPEGYPSTLARKRFDGDGESYELWDAPHDVLLSHPDRVADLLASVAET